MFDVLSRGFKAAQLKLQGKAQLTEENLAPALREVRTSLLQADVEFGVAKTFLSRVKERSLGEIVPVKAPGGQVVKVSPQDHFIKSCYDEMVGLMGPADASLDLDGKPAIILMVGLQGSGKTTTSGKLAKKFVAEGRKPLMVAADIYRPAAIDQLQVLGRRIGVPVYTQPDTDPVALAKQGVSHARNIGCDIVIIDTAGRLAVDDKLMQEVVDIKAAVRPRNVLFVVDAMIGQDAVKTAAEFDRRLDFTGFILTKLDGDARGGAALSIKEVTGKPVKFLGQGEDLDRLEEFRPEGLAQRILGFGDVVGLMQDFEKHVDQKTAQKDTEKMLQGNFTYDDFVRQLKMVRRMGPLRDIMAKMPIIGSMASQIPDEAEDELDRTLHIIDSMTKQERTFPDVMNESRFRRVAGGCGRKTDEVRDLHTRFVQARSMMKGLGGMLGNPKQMMAMQKQMQQMQAGGGFPGMPPAGMGGFPGMEGLPGMGGGPAPRKEVPMEDKVARRKKQKAARKARKRNRK